MLKIQDKLKDLPKSPGVYLYKNSEGKIIYVGKAAVLKNRVRQYFQKSRLRDVKTDALVADIRDVDWITVETELDALFLEAELVRRYMPQYNIALRDDRSSTFIRIDIKSDHPTVTLSRMPVDDNAEYYGPYYSTGQINRALHFLRRIFPFSTHKDVVPKRVCLQYQIGLCPGLEDDRTPIEEYRANLKKLISYIKGNRVVVIREVEKQMKQASKDKKFERASVLRNQFFALKGLSQQIVFGDKENLDISKDEGLNELTNLFGLKKAPYVIEGYDISHMSGTDNVASMVVFKNGVPSKSDYRKFKMHLKGNNDFAHMNETLTRRLKPQRLQQWGRPNLILIDGGKGQLDAALKARDEVGLKIPMIGLAKREEEIIVSIKDETIEIDKSKVTKASDRFYTILLPKDAHAVRLLQRIRDESHRFAVSYHTVLKRQRQTRSILEDIPGVGPGTRKKLLRTFGSAKQVSLATEKQIEKAIGPAKAKTVYTFVHGVNK
ncbi:MAG: excinuclease ABC subunit UvrC [bacterium]|nr:excinuclease ABC subunit UvrC [bacterium]